MYEERKVLVWNNELTVLLQMLEHQNEALDTSTNTRLAVGKKALAMG